MIQMLGVWTKRVQIFQTSHSGMHRRYEGGKKTLTRCVFASQREVNHVLTSKERKFGVLPTRRALQHTVWR